ncbi:MAG: hypothetical protein IKZ46_07095 [Victivallales bacterium]|nr:hypothetical protein [Victivallales bacterium]
MGLSNGEKASSNGKKALSNKEKALSMLSIPRNCGKTMWMPIKMAMSQSKMAMRMALSQPKMAMRMAMSRL